MRRGLEMAAAALSVPCLLYGLFGTVSTFVVWAVVELDPLRADFYMSLLAVAGASTYLLHLVRRVRARRSPAAETPAVRWPLLLNVAWLASALIVAVVRRDVLSDVMLAAALVVLTTSPLLNVLALIGAAGRRA